MTLETAMELRPAGPPMTLRERLRLLRKLERRARTQAQADTIKQLRTVIRRRGGK
jgi:hypothetical protein